MDCMKKLAYKMSKLRIRHCTTDMIVIRIGKNGNLLNSQPCYHCAIEMFRNKKIEIRNVYFSNQYGIIEKHNFKHWYLTANHHISSGWRYKQTEEIYCREINKLG